MKYAPTSKTYAKITSILSIFHFPSDFCSAPYSYVLKSSMILSFRFCESQAYQILLACAVNDYFYGIAYFTAIQNMIHVL